MKINSRKLLAVIAVIIIVVIVSHAFQAAASWLPIPFWVK